MVLKIYTDGGCRGNHSNHNTGAFATIHIKDEEEIYKYVSTTQNTTNNEMELGAVAFTLKILLEDNFYRLEDIDEIIVYCDSSYVINALTKGWLTYWQNNGWKTHAKKQVLNRHLWITVAGAIKQLKELGIETQFVKVAGHADNPYNNRCDGLLNLAMDRAINQNKSTVYGKRY